MKTYTEAAAACVGSGCFKNRRVNMRNNLFFSMRTGALFLPLILCSCAVWHRIESPPPKYTVYPTLSLSSRLTETNWYDSYPSLATRIEAWREFYTNALEESSPWRPDINLLNSTFKDACYESGYDVTDRDVSNLVEKASNILYNTTNGI